MKYSHLSLQWNTMCRLIVGVLRPGNNYGHIRMETMRKSYLQMQLSVNQSAT